MNPFSRTILSLIALMVMILSTTTVSWADEPPTGVEPAAPIEATANTRIYLPIIFMPKAALVNGNFESGNTAWAVASTHNLSLIRQSFAPNSVSIHSGSWGAWLGGGNNETNSLQQQITVPANTPYLAYWHWIVSNDLCGYDKASIWVNGTIVHQYDLCTATRSTQWIKKTVNLAAYAGQTVTLRLQVQNDSSLNSNLFIDDITFQASAASASEATADPVSPVEPQTGEDPYSLPQP